MSLKVALFWVAMMAGSVLLNSGFMYRMPWAAVAAGFIFAAAIMMG